MSLKAAQLHNGNNPMVSMYRFTILQLVDLVVTMQPSAVEGKSITRKIVIFADIAEAQLLRFFFVGALGLRWIFEVDRFVGWTNEFAGGGYNVQSIQLPEVNNKQGDIGARSANRKPAFSKSTTSFSVSCIPNLTGQISGTTRMDTTHLRLEPLTHRSMSLLQK